MDSVDLHHLQDCLDRLQAGDEAARRELLDGTCRRLLRLARRMLKDYRRLKRWEETDDVFQSAMLRLYQALLHVTPASLADFYRMAALQIRRELIDLARHYYGPEGQAANHASQQFGSADSTADHPAQERADESCEPGRLAAWTEFHQRAEELPEGERAVFDLLWYQGMGQSEAAVLLDLSARTVKRRWHAACLKLHDVLEGL